MAKNKNQNLWAFGAKKSHIDIQVTEGEREKETEYGIFIFKKVWRRRLTCQKKLTIQAVASRIKILECNDKGF